MVALFATFSAYAQTDIFVETCGDAGPSSGTRPSVDSYTGWDNINSGVTYSHTTQNFPDVRSTSQMDSHVWFPANKECDLVISGISTEGYTDLKLSFNVACNKGDQDNSNANKAFLEVNDVAVTIPDVPIPTQNTYVFSGEISIPASTTTKLRFHYTVENNPTNYGYRIDNIKITGTLGGVTRVDATTVLPEAIYAANGNIVVENAKAGETIAVYNATGQMLASKVANQGINTVSVSAKGILIVRAGDKVAKIIQ
ncbi:MAG: hypothetical protein LBS01_09415 [Prevotellaceae bacterium]|nr:hypothetical protein [Prevotellaceae bacterium]